MATFARAVTLKHRPSLGDDVQEIRFEEGDEITVLKEWAESCFCKDAQGRVFNIPKSDLTLPRNAAP